MGRFNTFGATRISILPFDRAPDTLRAAPKSKVRERGKNFFTH